MARLCKGRGSPRPQALVHQNALLDADRAICCANSVTRHRAVSFLPRKFSIGLMLIFAGTFLLAPAFAQTDINDVHVESREVEKPLEKPKDQDVDPIKEADAPKLETSKSDTSKLDSSKPDTSKLDTSKIDAPKADPVKTDTAKTDTPGPVLTAHVRPMKVDVDLVLVPVTITDPLNRLVTGLDRENFQLYEGNSAQEIRTFSSEDAPVSLGVIFDSSGSMSSKMDKAKDAVMEFFKTANPQDEFFMITFSDEPETVSDFTSSVEEIQDKLVYAVPRKRTALLDAIYMGVSKMRQAKYPKKALLIISDGGDNHSRYTEGEIKALVKEADVMVYAIGLYDRYFATQEERLGPGLLSEITELTGGRAFTIDNPNDLADVATKIGIELRNQYVLGYRPAKVVRDGKWRKIKVKLMPPKGLPPLRVYARTGYYAPAE
jgi:Ca-activated chloride channel family protein